MPAKFTKKKSASSTLWGFSPESLLMGQLSAPANGEGRRARVTVQPGKTAKTATRVLEKDDGVEIHLNPLVSKEAETEALLKSNASVRVRDVVGNSVGVLEKMEIANVEYNFELDAELLQSALMGLEIGLYRFKRLFKGEELKLHFTLKNRGKVIADKTIQQAVQRGVAVNLARHLVNLPPNLLNPVTYAEAVTELFAGQKNVKVEVWNEERLKKERMHLHLAVGQASNTPPRLVHIRYRPPGAKRVAPIALVGKGITFDSGGLDIKPSSGMRLMKKDMGGSAAVAGVAYWACATQSKTPLDVYMALAENAIGSQGFRPSDIFTARNGQMIEIHNTDAEGRLVLADAMDVAITQSEKPAQVIDVATLTGAIKVALGGSLAGLFSNDARMAQSLAKSCQQAGDFAWIMPLVQRYRSQMNSIFADQVNSVDGFGGAITAALFLEKFAGDVPWAHLDIYGWKDSADGAWLEVGGNGQSVLALTQYLS